MPEKTRILVLEDSHDDAELVRRLLWKANPDFEFTLASDKDSFLYALNQFDPNVILADNSLPQFCAREALEIARRQIPEIPFILVTGSVSEEFAAEIIKLGADDYILKDRLIRLPSAIEMAMKQRKAGQEKRQAQEGHRKSDERFQTLSKATKDAVWEWNLLTGEIWWNESCYTLLGYDPKLSAPGPDSWSKRIHPSDRTKVMARLKGIIKNGVPSWEDEFRIRLIDGSYGTVLERAYIVEDDCGEPVRVIGALVNITEKKKMEEERLTSKMEQQREVSRVILQAQEVERNDLGMELHDNINQILAAVNLKLAFFLEEPDGNLEIIEICRTDLKKAIMEARNLSNHMVMPRFSEMNLKDELEMLIQNYSADRIVRLDFNIANEKDISSAIKGALFRVAQEQLTNIVKHAGASEIEMHLSVKARKISMTIQDNGVGFDIQQKRKGIGFTNIYNRVESYNGIAHITSMPGKGCILSLSIPLTC